jgi:hypothetical protein
VGAAGHRVRLRYSVELNYDVAGPSAFLLNVHAAQTACQRVVEEFFDTTPQREVALDEDASTGNLMPGDIVSLTAVVVGFLPAAVARIVMSRSVIMPSNRLPSQTGKEPTSKSFIFWAAVCKEALGLTTSTSRVIMSLIFIILSSKVNFFTQILPPLIGKLSYLTL